MDSAPVPESPRRRSRLRRILIWTGSSLAVLALAVFFGAPPIIASVVHSKLHAALNDRLDGTATVGGVSFSWTSGATIRDLEIKDRAGAPLASVKWIAADLSLLSALGGRIIADVRIDSPRLEVRRGADGTVNLASLVKPTSATT